MIRFSEWRFIQYIATFGACQIVTILTVVIITFGYPQKLTMYTIPEDYVSTRIIQSIPTFGMNRLRTSPSGT